jgi:MoaA/NifB/PqqE/SkfB family radical SAM enzyme
MRSSDEIARRPAQQPRRPPTDLRLPLTRSGIALPWRCRSSHAWEQVPLADLVRAAGAAGQPGGLVVGGGNPFQRGDLWELLTELARLRPDELTVCTSGHGITAPLAARLRAGGVRRVLVPFHCARQDAHDWLVGEAGALKTALRTIRACVDAELPVTAEVVLTRPTMRHLAETIEVLARVGVRTVCVRRLTAHDTDGVEFVPLSARLALLEPSLEAAAHVALDRRLRVYLRDLPVCAAPRLRPLFAPADSESWLLPDGSVQTRTEEGLGCATCPGPPHCAGAPDDYVARFGWEEFIDQPAAAPRVHESVADQQRVDVSAPMALTWRGPRRLRCEACAEAVYDETHAQHPYEPSRAVRARLVQAARYRPALLRLVGAELLAHPQSAALIYDALRLFARVEVAGEASAIVDWSDLDLRRMKELGRLDVALFGPDASTHDAHCGMPGAFAGMLRGVERLRAGTAIPVGTYAIVHDARLVPAFAEAWARGTLPGTPRFRLSARGGSLDELVECARALPAGPARAALLAVLPRCLCAAAGLAVEERSGSSVATAPQQRIHCGRSLPYAPCGADPIGAFEPCGEDADGCALPGCPGAAVGWHSTARAQRWSTLS